MAPPFVGPGRNSPEQVCAGAEQSGKVPIRLPACGKNLLLTLYYRKDRKVTAEAQKNCSHPADGPEGFREKGGPGKREKDSVQMRGQRIQR